MKKGLTWSAAAACTVLAACDLSTGTDLVSCDSALLQLRNATGDTVTTTTGLQYIDLETGGGATVANGDLTRVHYSLYLTSGAFIQSSCGRPTFDLVLGTQTAITGFEQGIVGMRVGGVRRLIIPPELAYGNTPRQGIPPNSTLIFDIHLTDAE